MTESSLLEKSSEQEFMAKSWQELLKQKINQDERETDCFKRAVLEAKVVYDAAFGKRVYRVNPGSVFTNIAGEKKSLAEVKQEEVEEINNLIFRVDLDSLEKTLVNSSSEVSDALNSLRGDRKTLLEQMEQREKWLKWEYFLNNQQAIEKEVVLQMAALSPDDPGLSAKVKTIKNRIPDELGLAEDEIKDPLIFRLVRVAKGLPDDYLSPPVVVEKKELPEWLFLEDAARTPDLKELPGPVSNNTAEEIRPADAVDEAEKIVKENAGITSGQTIIDDSTVTMKSDVAEEESKPDPDALWKQLGVGQTAVWHYSDIRGEGELISVAESRLKEATGKQAVFVVQPAEFAQYIENINIPPVKAPFVGTITIQMSDIKASVIKDNKSGLEEETLSVNGKILASLGGNIPFAFSLINDENGNLSLAAEPSIELPFVLRMAKGKIRDFLRDINGNLSKPINNKLKHDKINWVYGGIFIKGGQLGIRFLKN